MSGWHPGKYRKPCPRLSHVIDMDRLGALIRILGRESISEPRAEWLVEKCRLKFFRADINFTVRPIVP